MWRRSPHRKNIFPALPQLLDLDYTSFASVLQFIDVIITHKCALFNELNNNETMELQNCFLNRRRDPRSFSSSPEHNFVWHSFKLWSVTTGHKSHWIACQAIRTLEKTNGLCPGAVKPGTTYKEVITKKSFHVAFGMHMHAFSYAIICFKLFAGPPWAQLLNRFHQVHVFCSAGLTENKMRKVLLQVESVSLNLIYRILEKWNSAHCNFMRFLRFQLFSSFWFLDCHLSAVGRSFPKGP